MMHKPIFAFVLMSVITLVGGHSWQVFAEEAVAEQMCAEHRVPEAICPFCRPELVKKLGFCSGHSVPEALCTVCRPALVEAFKAEGDWCAEHGVPEAQCETCHPGIKKQWQTGKIKSGEPRGDRLWCKEHGVYEDECVICHPESAKSSVASGSAELMCNEHRVLERECGICQPQLAAGLRPGESLKVRTVSADSAKLAGIRVASPTLSEVIPQVKVMGEVRYNQNRLVRITPLAPGVVGRVLVDVGQVVEAGQVLVEIASSDVAAAKRDYVIAMVDERLKRLAFEREKQLGAKAISPEKNVQQAEAEHERAKIVRMAARQWLVNLGFADKEIDDIEETKSTSSLLIVRSPHAGTVVKRTAVVGEAVEPGRALFTVADLSSMWVELALPESEAARVRKGLSVRATFAGLGDMEVVGELVWVHSQVDRRTRLIKARAKVPNPQGQLRDGMFGEVRVIVDEAVSTLRIPKNSLQRIEQEPYVFVQMSEDLFDLRRVVVGERNGDTVEILRGIQLSDAVVGEGAFTMKSEFWKSRLGAGCVRDFSTVI